MQIEDCETCKFRFAENCVRYPTWTRTPGWCGEWKPLWSRLCRARKLADKGLPGVSIGGKPFLPALRPRFDYCYLAPKHGGDHTDGIDTWTDVECHKEEEGNKK